jgi:hypothetical protein
MEISPHLRSELLNTIMHDLFHRIREQHAKDVDVIIRQKPECK